MHLISALLYLSFDPSFLFNSTSLSYLVYSMHRIFQDKFHFCERKKHSPSSTGERIISPATSWVLMFWCESARATMMQGNTLHPIFGVSELTRLMASQLVLGSYDTITTRARKEQRSGAARYSKTNNRPGEWSLLCVKRCLKAVNHYTRTAGQFNLCFFQSCF